MNVLIDIGHPGHVHLLKNAAECLKRDGHKVFWSVRDIPVAKRLMEHYGMEYYDLGAKKRSILGKGLAVIVQDFKLFRFVRKHKIDVGLSSGIVLSHISRVTPMASIVFDDDDDAVEKLVVRWGHPFSDVVLTPASIRRNTKRSVYYAGTHELAYLHPDRFVPDVSVLDRAGLKEGERFFVLRFVAFQGHHDINQHGLNIEQKRKLVSLLKKNGRVIITSEIEIEPEFEEYRISVPPYDIHSLLSFSAMFLGDSQTMTSEAAILGVPALKCNTFAGRLSVPNELETKYGLCYAFHPDDFGKFYDKVKSLLEQDGLKEEWSEKRKRFLAEHIDVTAFFTWFIENYPASMAIMQQNPDYQLRFR